MNTTARIALAATGPSMTVEERAEAAGFEQGTWGFRGFVDGYNGLPKRKFGSTANPRAISGYWHGYQVGEAS